MNALHKYAAKRLLIEKLANRTTSASTSSTALVRKDRKAVPVGPQPPKSKGLPATKSSGRSGMKVRLEGSDIVDILDRAAKRHRNVKAKRIMAAHKKSPDAYHPGTTKLKRWYKPDGSLKPGVTSTKRNRYWNPILPTGPTHFVRGKGDKVDADETRAITPKWLRRSK